MHKGLSSFGRYGNVVKMSEIIQWLSDQVMSWRRVQTDCVATLATTCCSVWKRLHLQRRCQKSTYALIATVIFNAQ